MVEPYLQTLGNGLVVLEALHEKPRTQAELVEDLGMNRLTTYRVLRTLEVHRMVDQDPVSGRYSLAVKLWEYGVEFLANSGLRPKVEGPALELRGRWGDTVHVAVYDSGSVVYIHKLDGTEALRSYTALGGRAPARCVATGKALLAFQSETEVKRQITASLPAFTAATIQDEEILRRELEAIRAAKVAVNRGEWRAGVGGIASPILTSDGSAIGALGISGPVDRILDEMWQDRAEHIRTLAAGISASLVPSEKQQKWDHIYELGKPVGGLPVAGIWQEKAAQRGD
ncbi:IclR family transcriptional regulator [Rhodococcus koreensis]|uniref:IclR family transcriptional regulator n=1 Tax=Rhodococcus koreensis TaxID=99653 RepID=UPI00366D746C